MKNKNVLKWALIVGIIIVLNLFFHFSTTLIYKAPKYDDFCSVKQVNIQPTTQKDCLAIGGGWNENGIINSVPNEPVAVSQTKPISSAYCDINFTCQKKYQTAIDLYQRNVFVILVLLGVVSLVIGLLTASNAVISLGLSYGGVLSFIIASIGYWSAMDDYLRVIILGLALIALIILGVKKFKD